MSKQRNKNETNTKKQKTIMSLRTGYNRKNALPPTLPLKTEKRKMNSNKNGYLSSLFNSIHICFHSPLAWTIKMQSTEESNSYVKTDILCVVNKVCIVLLCLI